MLKTPLFRWEKVLPPQKSYTRPHLGLYVLILLYTYRPHTHTPVFLFLFFFFFSSQKDGVLKTTLFRWKFYTRPNVGVYDALNTTAAECQEVGHADIR